MEQAVLKEKLIAILKQIQTDSGLDCPELSGQTKPVESIPRFDSKIWPVATSILAVEIDATIPNDMNIFFDESTKLPKSIDQIVGFVCELVKKQHENVGAAA